MLVYESLDDILKPKSESDIKRDLKSLPFVERALIGLKEYDQRVWQLRSYIDDEYLLTIFLIALEMFFDIEFNIISPPALIDEKYVGFCFKYNNGPDIYIRQYNGDDFVIINGQTTMGRFYGFDDLKKYLDERKGH